MGWAQELNMVKEIFHEPIKSKKKRAGSKACKTAHGSLSHRKLDAVNAQLDLGKN